MECKSILLQTLSATKVITNNPFSLSLSGREIFSVSQITATWQERNYLIKFSVLTLPREYQTLKSDKNAVIARVKQSENDFAKSSKENYISVRGQRGCVLVFLFSYTNRLRLFYDYHKFHFNFPMNLTQA